MSKKEDMRKSMAPKPKKSSMKISARSPADSMSVGAANSLPMGPAVGLRPGMKAGGACKGYAKGGSIDGIAQKGKTRGKVC
jgi:hypothetical protein